ncbi:MAG: ASKHA domain-containing protein [Bryobacteraceae bacterium]
MEPANQPTHRVILVPSGRQGDVPEGALLLDAARSLGVDLESICGGRQTCGKCQISIEEGDFPKHAIRSHGSHLTPLESKEQACLDRQENKGRRLACAAKVFGDLLVFVPDESQAHKQVIAKAATDRIIHVRPAVRQVYVECEAPELDDRRGDWERLQQALAEQWGIRGLTIDPLALRSLQAALREGKNALSVTIWQNVEVLRVQPGYSEGLFGIAIDVGSTTVAGYLCDLRTGALLGTAAIMNPQVRFGEDLMSRVSYAMTHAEGTTRLHEAIVAALNHLVAECARAANIDPLQIVDVVLVGNSVMHHLMLGIDPVELGGAPFALAISGPLDVKARDLGITAANLSARVHVLPCIAGQNGADNMAVLLAEAPHRQDRTMLVVDIGTNAEILLGDRNRILAASSPTGPAFEGAQIKHGQRAAPGAIERVRIQPGTFDVSFKVVGGEGWSGESGIAPATGICGSGIIEAVAELLLAGVIDQDGQFNEQVAQSCPRVRFQGRTPEFVLAERDQTSIGGAIVVTQNDVRAIQLAKGALFAGIKLLMRRMGVTALDEIRLAGAFGSFISPRHAMVLGLIPDCDPARVIAVGNAAGDGARMALLDREVRVEAVRLAQEVEYVSIAVEPSFQEEFVAAMRLPYGTNEPRKRRRERRRQAAYQAIPVPEMENYERPE